ncbi:right-handed parallel beta-helix repeat-containing protein [Elizabethkingia sp. JS20170427COW]|uniref:alpha-1,3-galactosidase-related protein n=1 Tax=Elizabethkingia sp. JS20170427COW TaxID=2583851 RepID=UPI00111024F9|nr:right-handed parallel beta-helix repeat-containing protein [Elizabethkingia sp. JS20170427COW]QCX53829.1 right-handed parallel beta-helix repeat-containing protein [Elizabethkingia sp. JS20170427COW]
MRRIFFLFIAMMIALTACSIPQKQQISVEDFGIKPNQKQNYSTELKNLIQYLEKNKGKQAITIIFPKGRYDFYEENAFIKEYYISNHDQVNPKKVAFALENLENITIDGQGSDFIFHGRMIPFSIIKGKNIRLKDLSIDFEIPALRQLKITQIDKKNNEAIAEIYPKGNYEIEKGKLKILGEGYHIFPNNAMPFQANKRLAYKRSDVGFNPKSITEIAPNTFKIKDWEQIALSEVGERFVLRSWGRPTPGIFVSESKDTYFQNVTVHYAEGMGLLAQMSENLFLDHFSVALRGDNDPRFFTTQADATHFSACKGVIISKNGLYEGMADDAINIHGTYLRILKKIDSNTLQAQYMHPQAWGFKWGEKGDKVQFVESEKMELIGNGTLRIENIKAVDQPTEKGAKIFEITFNKEVPSEITEKGKFGIENLTWTPKVVFENNTIRNNRARGSLFSTPKSVICQNNLFDHTHGAAILLAGDCNGWFETGASKDVVIRNNTFINALTSQYQFTNAIISIYPEIPKLEQQKKFFHSGIVIENNRFETFDKPLLYAKSVDGLIFRNNTIIHNQEFPAFHWNQHAFFFEKVKNVKILNNHFDEKIDFNQDILLKYTNPSDVQLK